MKTQMHLYLILFLIGIITFSCQKENQVKHLKASLSSNLICKSNLKSADAISDTISRVEYQYEESTKNSLLPISIRDLIVARTNSLVK